MRETLLEVRDVEYGYDHSNTILHGVSVDFEGGMLCGIIGPNGSGKTTLIKLLSGENRPTKGHVLLDGRDIAGYRAHELARRISVVPQSSHMDFVLTALDVALMGRQPYIRRFERESDEDIRIADEALTHTDVREYRDKAVTELSGGEMQRVIIARALAQQTDVMLLDEPVSNLDIRHAAQILKLVRTLTHEKQVCGVCVLHDLGLAGWFCDRLVLMQGGRIYACGSPQDVLTSRAIRDVYGIDADIIHKDGHVYVLPEYE